MNVSITRPLFSSFRPAPLVRFTLPALADLQCVVAIPRSRAPVPLLPCVVAKDAYPVRSVSTRVFVD